LSPLLDTTIAPVVEIRIKGEVLAHPVRS